MLVEAHAGPGAIADIVALIPARGGALVCDATGTCRHSPIEEARKLFRSGDVLIAHAAFVSGRLRTPPSLPLFDAMELFAFVRPAQPCVPSALGLARALGLEWPRSPEGSARALPAAANKLPDERRGLPEKARVELVPLVGTLAGSGWRWADAVREAIGARPDHVAGSPIAGLEVWRNLKPWED